MNRYDDQEIFGFIECKNRSDKTVYINVSKICYVRELLSTTIDGERVTIIKTSDGDEHAVIGHHTKIIKEIRRHQKGM